MGQVTRRLLVGLRVAWVALETLSTFTSLWSASALTSHCVADVFNARTSMSCWSENREHGGLDGVNREDGKKVRGV